MAATEPGSHAIELHSHSGDPLFRIERHDAHMNFAMAWGGGWQWVTVTPDQAFALADQLLKVAKTYVS